jgi:hypothetical protein
MLDELIKEIKELQEYKNKYECQLKDKQRMSDKLLELMTEKYNSQSYAERCEIYKNEMCNSCRYSDCCKQQNNLPKDIWKPIKSDKAWIPGNSTCGSFEWS